MDGSKIVHIPSFDSNWPLFQSHRYNLSLDDLNDENNGNYSCVAEDVKFNITVQENFTISVMDLLGK